MKTENGEILWASYLNVHGELRFTIRSDRTRETYKLYNAKGKLIGEDKSPNELIAKYNVMKKLEE